MVKRIIIFFFHQIRKILMLFFLIYEKIKHVFLKHIWPKKKFFSEDKFKTVYMLYEADQIKKSYDHFKKFFNNTIFLNHDRIKLHALETALNNDKQNNFFYLEFGVLGGNSINLFSNYLNTKIYGFDSFVGLKENMSGADHSKGDFNLKGKIPHLNKNVVPIKGWVQDTLPIFLKEKNPIVNFIHMDLDTYESTLFTLKSIKPYLNKNCIITFDDFYNFAGWEHGEHKAFIEVFMENEFEYVSFSKYGRQVTVKIK